MATEKSTDPGTAARPTIYSEEERHQAMVLRKVLDLRPETLTRDELIRELTDSEPGDCPKFEALRRAVGELAGSGLLHRPGTDEMVRPTRAAVRYAELTEEAV